MRKSRKPTDVTPLNAAAYRIGAEALRSGGLERLLEETLAQVFGSLGEPPATTAGCTEFTCNVYAPIPPPTNG